MLQGSDDTHAEARPDGRTVAKAMALLLKGETEAGLGLYRCYLKIPDRPMPPVGMHLLFLERAGQEAAAAALLRLALANGINVARKAGGFGAAPEEAAAEYEALFARSIANATMIQDYLLALSRLGRGEEVAALHDPARLLRVVPLEPAEGCGTAAALARDVADLLLREEQRANYQEAEQSVRRMRLLPAFHRLDDPAARALLAAIERESAVYLGNWAAAGHPFSPLVPARGRIDAWGLISRGEGYNSPHIHRIGWATGVYYPIGIEGGAGGDLRIGAPQAADGAPGWPDIAIRPEAGLLVLMPSFYTHWTVPLGAPGLRLSVAFDLLPDGRDS